MKKTRSVQLGAVNIALHPHTPERYAEFWKAIFDLAKIVKVRGETCYVLGSMEQIDPANPLEGFFGHIFRFLAIDLGKPWLDLKKGDEASPERVKEVVIPDGLFPNLTKFAYTFYPKQHRLVFEASRTDHATLSPRFVEKLITSLSGDPRIAAQFPESEVTMEQDRQEIEALMETALIKVLIITVKRPNPDGHDHAEDEEVFEALDEENAKKKKLVLQSVPGKTLTPNEETKKLARVAASNGHVDAKVVKDGKSVNVSSREKPMYHDTEYDPKQVVLKDHILMESAKFAIRLAEAAKPPKDEGNAI